MTEKGHCSHDGRIPLGREPLVRCLLSVAAIVFLLAAAGCQPRPPIVQIHDVEVSAMTLRQMDVVFVFKLINVNTFGATMTSLDAEMVTSAGPIAAGGLREEVKLPAQDAALVRVPMTLEHARVLSILRNISRQSVPYELKGSTRCRVAGVTVSVPISHKGEVPQVRLPQVKIRTARIETGDDGNRVILVLDVTNPNVFAIPMVSLAGSVSAGGQPVVSLDESPTKELAPAATTEVDIPVRVGAVSLMSATRALATGQKFDFDGQLKFGAPVSVRQMLLGQK